MKKDFSEKIREFRENKKGCLKSNEVVSHKKTPKKTRKILNAITVVCFMASLAVGIPYVANVINDYPNSQNEVVENLYDLNSNINKRIISEDEVRANCERLGVEYTDLNASGKWIEPYQQDGTLVDDVEGVYRHRLVPKDGSTIKVIASDNISDEQYKIAKAVVDEINYIGENIGDDVKYELVRASTGITKRDCDISIQNKDYIAKRKNGNEVKGECSVKNVNKPEGKYETNINISMNLSNIDGNADYESTLLHELCHAVYDAKDIYATKTGIAEVNSFVEMADSYFSVFRKTQTGKIITFNSDSNYNSTIMNRAQLPTGADVLLRCAKNSYDVDVNADKYIDFAEQYDLESCVFTLLAENGENENITPLQMMQAYRTEKDHNLVELINRVKKSSVSKNDKDAWENVWNIREKEFNALFNEIVTNELLAKTIYESRYYYNFGNQILNQKDKIEDIKEDSLFVKIEHDIYKKISIDQVECVDLDNLEITNGNQNLKLVKNNGVLCEKDEQGNIKYFYKSIDNQIVKFSYNKNFNEYSSMIEVENVYSMIDKQEYEQSAKYVKNLNDENFIDNQILSILEKNPDLIEKDANGEYKIQNLKNGITYLKGSTKNSNIYMKVDPNNLGEYCSVNKDSNYASKSVKLFSIFDTDDNKDGMIYTNKLSDSITVYKEVNDKVMSLKYDKEGKFSVSVLDKISASEYQYATNQNIRLR